MINTAARLHVHHHLCSAGAAFLPIPTPQKSRRGTTSQNAVVSAARPFSSISFACLPPRPKSGGLTNGDFRVLDFAHEQAGLGTRVANSRAVTERCLSSECEAVAWVDTLDPPLSYVARSAASMDNLKAVWCGKGPNGGADIA